MAAGQKDQLESKEMYEKMWSEAYQQYIKTSSSSKSHVLKTQ